MPPDLSVSLYNYLCQKLGTEDIVKVRRLSFAISDYTLPLGSRYLIKYFGGPIMTLISSGSKAEGLDMKTSDMDIMVVIEFANVVEDPVLSFGLFSFLISSEYTKPGFVRLKLDKAFIHIDIFYKERDGHIFLSSDLVKKIPFSQLIKYCGIMLHGPCLTSLDESHDAALCLRSKSWIAQAQEWVYRNRVWPSFELVSHIVSYGTLFVPIGTKYSLNEDLEWRISFSVAEKHLIYSFTHTQLLSYALLKILLKEVIELDTVCKGLLCSYFIKTVVFWVSEESSSLKPEYFISCFNRLIHRLRYYVQINFLPHYFISEVNLLENRCNIQQQKVLVDMLTEFCQKGIYCFFNSDSLSIFFATDCTSWNLFSNFDYKFVYNPVSTFLRNIWLNRSPNSFIVLFRRQKLSLHRYLHTLQCCAMCEHLGYTNIVLQERSNKDQYKRYKKYFPYLVIGLQKDAFTGWLCFASYFFSMDNFNTCLSLIRFVLQKSGDGETSDIKSHTDNITSLGLKSMRYGVINAPNISKFHFVDMQGFSKNFIIRPLKLKLEILDNLFTVNSPLVFTYFLRFMCFFHLNDLSGVQCAFRDLQRVCHYGCWYDLYCLGLAYYTLMEYSYALSIFIPFLKFLEADSHSHRNIFVDDFRYKLDFVITKLKREIS